MLATVGILESLADVVIRAAWQESAHPHGRYAKRGGFVGGVSLGQSSPQILIDDRVEGASGFSGLGLEARSNVVIQGEGGAHTS